MKTVFIAILVLLTVIPLANTLAQVTKSHLKAKSVFYSNRGTIPSFLSVVDHNISVNIRNTRKIFLPQNFFPFMLGKTLQPNLWDLEFVSVIYQVLQSEFLIFKIR